MCSLSRSKARGLLSAKRAQSTRLNPCHSSRAQVVSKQLRFEKIRRVVEWKEKLMRQQSPARSTTLPSSGNRGEDT